MEVNHSHHVVYTHKKHVFVYIAIIAVVQIKFKVLLDQLIELHDKLFVDVGVEFACSLGTLGSFPPQSKHMHVQVYW